MYDFCFTPVYAMALAMLGVVQYVFTENINALGAGVAAALVLGVLTYISLEVFLKQDRKCVSSIVLSLGASVVIAVVSGLEFKKDMENLIPAVGTLASVLMCAYYIWNLGFVPSVHKTYKPIDTKAGAKTEGNKTD